MSTLFPPIDPYTTGYYDTGDGHHVYYELCGNPQGIPVIFLHGGPGGGCSPYHRQLFDPSRFHVLLFDQRGCGRSTPNASLDNNSTWHLVADIHHFQQTLFNGQPVVVFGGSWGSTLALAYAQTHPNTVRHLVLRGIFLCTPEEISWFYQEGASWVYPDYWEDFVAPIPAEERHDLLQAFHRRLNNEPGPLREAAAKAWALWEGRGITLLPNDDMTAQFSASDFTDAFARIETHYFVNEGFFTSQQLLRNVDRIRHIPTHIVQGRYDMCTPMRSAWALHKAFPEAQFVLVPDAGHAVSEPGIQAALLSIMANIH